MLKKILEFLLDDSKWSLESASTCLVSSGCQNATALKSQITSLLSGDDLSSTDFNLLYRHVALEDRISQGSHKNAKKFLQAIRFYGIHQQKLTAKESQWLTVRDTLRELLVCAPVKCDLDIGDEDINLKGDAIRFLRELGYEIPLVEGRFATTRADEKKFGEAMRYRFNKIGAMSICVFLDNIRDLYNDNTRRYDFRLEPASIGSPHIVPPWGYLLNVALSFVQEKGKTQQKNIEKTVNEILSLSQNFFTVWELQPLSKFSDVFRSHTEIVDEIMEGILYNQHIALDQYPLEVMLEIIRDLEYARASTHDNPIARILEWICRQKKTERPETLRFKRADIVKDLSGVLSDNQISEALECLTIKGSDLNKGYFIPREVNKRNYYKRPLVLTCDYYVLFDSNLWAKGFYLSWLDKYGKGCDLGILFESMLRKQLSAKNVKFLSGEKYSITSKERTEFGIKSKEGECDFIIDTAEKIYFIELKKKEITGNAMSGDSLAALSDMSKSALAAFVQAAKHELILRQRGKLVFESGNIVELNGRRVEKIHISAFDRYGLHDKMLVKRLLESLICCNFTSSDEEQLSDFKEVQREIKMLVSNKVVNAVYSNGSYLLTFRSFSIPQLIFALGESHSGNDFTEQLDMTSCMTTGTKDWYYEQVFISKIRGRRGDK